MNDNNLAIMFGELKGGIRIRLGLMNIGKLEILRWYVFAKLFEDYQVKTSFIAAIEKKMATEIYNQLSEEYYRMLPTLQ